MSAARRTAGFATYAACLLLSSCIGAATEVGTGPTAGVGITVPEPAEQDLGPSRAFHGPWYDLYFTAPGNPLARQESGGLDTLLAAAVDGAVLSVDLAAYRLDTYPFRVSLLRAHDRGVRVRVVMDGDELESPDAQALSTAGIQVVGDGPDGLMHNKFMILDGREVWTGSMNYTISGAYSDLNAVLHVPSRELADHYTREFDEMFDQGEFGPNTVSDRPFPRIEVGSAQVDVLFSPDDGVSDHLVELLSNASESIDFLAFSFTSDPLGEAIRASARAGVSVRGVMDADQVRSNVGSEYDNFVKEGLPIRRDAWIGQMHHKVIIIDEQIVVAGSYNFSNSAEVRNDENVLVIYDGGMASIFLAEFQRIFEAAVP